MSILAVAQVKGGDIYRNRKENRPKDLVTFYAQASVELLANQLGERQTLGSRGRDSREFNPHYNWAKGVEPKVLKKELIQKFNRMVEIKAKEGKEALVNYYALVCVTWSRYGINFGTRRANSTDFDLHKNWAMGQTPRILRENIIMRMTMIYKEFVTVKCLVSGTKVVMSDRTFKNIEDIKIGDKIKSWDNEKRELIESTVTEIFSPVHEDIVHLIFEHAEVKSTSDHPYYVIGKGWYSVRPELTKDRYKIEANKLTIGDICCFYKDGMLKKTTLKSIRPISGKVKTYTLKLDNSNNFFANGILVHNEN
jgi:hypothetical protein